MSARGLFHLVRICAPGVALALASCGGGGGSSGPSPIAPITLEPGARYFSIDGKEQFLASRNIAGRDEAEYMSLLDKASAEGTRLVRFHLTHLGGMGIASDGGVVESWAATWDRVFDHAQAKGIYVLPVFAVWADWNDGPDAWDNWKNNPLNRVVGTGHQTNPRDLLVDSSWVRTMWLGWLGNLVARFSMHDNVAAWESFSELDGLGRWEAPPTQADALAFLQAAAAVIKGADPRQRPVTASTGGWNTYPDLYANAGVDIAQFHYYANSDGKDFDVGLHDIVASLHAAGKPVLIGEGGLDYRAPDGTTATTLPHHETATRHAVWAALVSGATNGRALWWEDGYDILQNPDTGGPAFVASYPGVETPVVRFLDGVDVAGFGPLASHVGAAIGGEVGDDATALAWLRTAGCSRTHGWDCSTAYSSSFLFSVTGSSQRWHVTLHDTTTGEVLQDLGTLTRAGDSVSVELPSFSDDIAVKMVAVP